MNKEWINIFSKRIRSILERTTADFLCIEEIRLRSGQPLIFCIRGQNVWIDPGGGLAARWQDAYVVLPEDIRETVDHVSRYSLYAFEEEVRQGYITVAGGHRVGLAGKAVVSGSEIRGMKYISFLNVRLAHQVIGCADPFMPYIYHGNRVGHTLIISPPGMGKTTLLRDIIRQISDGSPSYSVAVADERSEIGACLCGVPQHDLGRNTDVMDGCPKAEGIRMLIRTMAPDVIAMDEVGSEAEMKALFYGSNCGCSVLAAVHGNSLDDVRRKPILGNMIEEHLFHIYILLYPGHQQEVRWKIMDRDGRTIKEGIR